MTEAPLQSEQSANFDRHSNRSGSGWESFAAGHSDQSGLPGTPNVTIVPTLTNHLVQRWTAPERRIPRPNCSKFAGTGLWLFVSEGRTLHHDLPKY
ncbi:hypothetical protein RB5549 [Rhodopirellula baltica SH 1]|uniref:Uncharacterized protein n=1 Tax=Rhodopirellula baltica (strain DSM 10527 / NCIMB 13988 / SH1) TaxID=243090 RepID=Q7URN7_RHOBA|nr:hypothetical protein RB5549 [Rhodopirellula baltica SH 1]